MGDQFRFEHVDPRDRIVITPQRPLGALGRIVAVRDKQKAMGYTPVHDANVDLVEITGLISGNVFDALKSTGEKRKQAFARIGALAYAGIEREEEVERAREAARLAQELSGQLDQADPQ
tara:strand:+ start:737 stop:1093 length:357 start_codon:yes stop_codon:yes gene_type:complete